MKKKIYKKRKENFVDTFKKGNIILGRKKPKLKLLYNKKKDIELMLLSLYAIPDILHLLNRLGLSVSDTTLLRFLKLYMPVEYEQNLKMRYFSDRITSIRNLKHSQKNIFNEELFKKLNFSGNLNGKFYLNLTLEDFLYFMKEYYNQAADKIFGIIKNEQKPEIDSLKITTLLEKDAISKKEPVINDDNDDKKYQQFPDSRDIENIKVDLDVIPVVDLNAKPVNSKTMAFKKMAEAPLRDIPYCENFKYIRFATLTNPVKYSTFVHFDSEAGIELRQKYQARAIPMVLDDWGDFKKDFSDWDSIPDNVVVYEGQFDWRRTSLYNYPALQYIEYNKQEERITELYLYVDEIHCINLIDFDTFKLVDGQAILTRHKRDEYSFRHGDYDLYRYFNGAFYFMNSIDAISGWSPSFSNILEEYGTALTNGQCNTAMTKYYIYNRQKGSKK